MDRETKHSIGQVNNGGQARVVSCWMCPEYAHCTALLLSRAMDWSGTRCGGAALHCSAMRCTEHEIGYSRLILFKYFVAAALQIKRLNYASGPMLVPARVQFRKPALESHEQILNPPLLDANQIWIWLDLEADSPRGHDPRCIRRGANGFRFAWVLGCVGLGGWIGLDWIGLDWGPDLRLGAAGSLQ